MDESDLFPGFDRPEDRRQEDGKKRRRAKRGTAQRPAAGGDPNPAPGPDAVAAAPATAVVGATTPAKPTPVRLVTPHDLAASTLEHLSEFPMLGETASAIVEHCLAANARFPHTLLVGPADSSKRVIAQAIAMDMAAPFHAVEMLHINGPDALHNAFRAVPAGAVVLVSGIDTVTPNALADLSRAVDARESVRDTTLRDLMREVDGEPWKRAGRQRGPRAYADFTVVLTSRSHVPSDSPLHRWVQLQYFTQRNAKTESARMDRAFRRLGIRLEPQLLSDLARFAVTFKVRTLQAVASMAMLWDTVRKDAYARAACGMPPIEADAQAGEASTSGGVAASAFGDMGRVLEQVFEHAMDPEQVKKMRRFLRRTAA